MLRSATTMIGSLLITLSCHAADDSLIPQPDSDPGFVSAHFSGSANCAGCHNDLFDEAGTDVSIEREWSGSMMANALRDPVFQAKVASEIRRNPHLAAVISRTCLRCHAPMASVDADFDDTALSLLTDSGVLDPVNPYHDQAMDGVSCTLCHQIEDSAELGEAESFSGGFDVPSVDESLQRVAYGQYPRPRSGAMLQNTGFEPVHSAHISESSLCATCHNLHTPFVDGDGNIVSEDGGHGFPEQMAYSEWLHSDFADDGERPASCQACHMPRADGVLMATRPKTLQPVDGFARHGFVGANTVVLALLEANREELGVTATGLDAAVSSSRDFLKGAAGISIVSVSRSEDSLEVVVEVVNNTGHKLPTGYPSRRIWINFQVLDGDGNRLFQSGRMRSDGSIVGVNADNNPPNYEPHWRVITRASQVQVYESIMGDTEGNLTFTLLAAAQHLKDNRIPPAGFDKQQVPEDVAVVGRAMSDRDFNAGKDRVIYRVPVPSAGPLVVKAALRYQPLSAAYLTDLFRDKDLPLVARLQRYWDNADVRVETIARVTHRVE